MLSQQGQQKHQRQQQQHIQVYARVRPLNQDDADEKQETEELLISGSDDDGNDGSSMSQQYLHSVSQDRDYKDFAYCFAPSASQPDVYARVAKPMVAWTMQGFNCTIFAYGQTGSGKTHTMLGKPSFGSGSGGDSRSSNRGIIPRMMHDLFDAISQSIATQNTRFTVEFQYVQIYEKRIQDLLEDLQQNNNSNNSGRKNQIRNRLKSVERQMNDDVTVVTVNNADEVLQLIQRGSKNRRTAKTDMNDTSSRSHAVVQMIITQTNKKKNETKRSKLVLVDLAGSERQKTANKADNVTQQKEASHINTSLMFLGIIVNQLANPKKKRQQQQRQQQQRPTYNNCILTRLLKDSLGGNSRTSLILALSPSSRHAHETKLTLQFGERAVNVTNRPIINQEKSIQHYKQLLAAEKRKVRELTRQQLESGAAGVANELVDELTQANCEIDRLRKENNLLTAELQRVCNLQTALIGSSSSSSSSILSDTTHSSSVSMSPIATATRSQPPSRLSKSILVNVHDDDNDDDDENTDNNAFVRHRRRLHHNQSKDTATTTTTAAAPTSISKIFGLRLPQRWRHQSEQCASSQSEQQHRATSSLLDSHVQRNEQLSHELDRLIKIDYEQKVQLAELRRQLQAYKELNKQNVDASTRQDEVFNDSITQRLFINRASLFSTDDDEEEDDDNDDDTQLP